MEHTPNTYQIQVEGRLTERWSSLLAGMRVSVAAGANGAAVTTLTGILPDEAALHGLLTQIRDLGLHLLLVRRMEETTHNS